VSSLAFRRPGHASHLSDGSLDHHPQGSDIIRRSGGSRLVFHYQMSGDAQYRGWYHHCRRSFYFPRGNKLK
jgi:hypothetical protein